MSVGSKHKVGTSASVLGALDCKFETSTICASLVTKCSSTSHQGWKISARINEMYNLACILNTSRVYPSISLKNGGKGRGPILGL